MTPTQKRETAEYLRAQIEEIEAVNDDGRLDRDILRLSRTAARLEAEAEQELRRTEGPLPTDMRYCEVK